ncbi:MAG: hypothetical protein IJR46_00045 [Neisseriaceae bacterium]|nr:hypothetical protein [Neisseriaceae bacterium]
MKKLITLFVLMSLGLNAYAETETSKAEQNTICNMVALSAKHYQAQEKDDAEVKIKGAFCQDNTLTVQYELNPSESDTKMIKEMGQEIFNDRLSEEVMNTFCNPNYPYYISPLARPTYANLPIKFQYFFKGESEPYGEALLPTNACKK